MNPDPTVQVRDLRKVYTVHEKDPGFVGSLRAFVRRRSRDVEAVRGVSFDLQGGETVGFLGPNGAGKTTTLKMLSGLLHPSGGAATVLGFEPRRRQADFLRQITLVMGQKQQLIWDLPAQDSFLVNQAIYEIPDREYRERLGEFSEALGLHGILRKQVRKLSLGERMKCELAAALLHRPKVLFLDEPTIGLDVNMQEAVREFVREYNARYGATVILTSHYMADVTALARRVLVIDRGELVFDGDLGALSHGSARKTIRLELRRPAGAEELAMHGEVVSLTGLSAEMSVPRSEVSAHAAALLSHFDVADLTVEDPPIEAVLASLFGRSPALQEER